MADLQLRINRYPFEYLLLLVFISFFWVGKIYAVVMVIMLVMLLLFKKSASNSRIIFCKRDAYFFVASIFALLATIDGTNVDFNLIVKIILLPALISFAIYNIDYSKEMYLLQIKVIIFVLFAIICFMFFQVESGVFDFSLKSMLLRSRTEGFYFLDSETPNKPTIIATILVIELVLVAGIIIFDNARRVIYMPILCVSLVMFIVSAGRASWGASLIILVYLLFVKRRDLKFIAFFLFAFVIFALLGLPIILEFQSDTDFIDRVLVLTDLGQDSSATTRWYYWGEALNLVVKNPFGYGYSYFLNSFGATTHNELLGQLVGIGVVGCAALVINIVHQFVHFYRLPSSETLVDFIFYSVFIIFFVVAQVENLSFSGVSLAWPLIWILLVSSHKMKVCSARRKKMKSYN